MIPREKFLSTKPQVSSVSKWGHRSCLQQMGHMGNLNRSEKALRHRKHHPWGWNMGMGALFKWRIYSPVFMRKCYIALKAFCFKNQLGQTHVQQCYLLFHLWSNKLSWACCFVQPSRNSLPQEQSTQACPCSCTRRDPTCQPLWNSLSP